MRRHISTSMAPSARLLGFLASLALAPLLRAETALAASSPFLPADGSAAASAENTPLELRGIMADGGGYRFSVYDPARHAGQWVRLNEAGHDFTVKSHDVTGDSITLEYQGRVLNLPLHSAKVVGVALADPRAGPRPNGVVQGGGPVPQPPSAEEQARYKRAVEEINRRRAAREKGPVPTAQPR
jgi:hypothetical protein